KTASTDAELEPAFAALAEAKISALFIPNDAFFNSRSKRLIDLAALYKLSTLYPWREFVDLGGLMSFGPSFPVLLPAKFNLVINATTAAAQGIVIPRLLRVSASQIIQ